MHDRATLLRELDTITRKLDAVDALRSRRREIVAELRAGGMLAKDIAERTGLTHSAISQMRPES